MSTFFHFWYNPLSLCVDVFYGWSLIIVTVFLSAFYSPGVSTTCCNWTNRPISLQDCVLWPYWFVIFCDLCQIKLNHRYNPFSQRYCTQTPGSSWPILDYTPSNGCSAYCVTAMFFLLFSPVYDAWTNVILCYYLLRVANFDGRMPLLAACHCIIFNVRPGYSFMLVLLGE